MPKAMFITIEGIEGVGKSTAMTFIQSQLITQNIPFICTREPGGTEVAEQIRQILLNPHMEEVLQPETELLLMFASRMQHIANVISPALKAGKWVLSDRFVDASFAYQGGGRQINLSYIETLSEWVVGKLQPSVTFLLDAPPALGLARAKHRGPHDRIEKEKIEFFERVREVYLLRAKKYPERFKIIDATQSLPAVEKNLLYYLSSLGVA